MSSEAKVSCLLLCSEPPAAFCEALTCLVPRHHSLW